MTREKINHNTVVWILDEAQLSYDDGDIWGSFIKNQHGRYGNGSRICVFSSYGSPSTAIEELYFGPGSPPIHLGPGQRVSIAPSRIQGLHPYHSSIPVKSMMMSCLESAMTTNVLSVSILMPSSIYSVLPVATLELLKVFFQCSRWFVFANPLSPLL